MTQPLVTIVIPTYKRSHALLRAIDSALNQTYSPIEIIVVDDNGLNTPEQLETQSALKKYLDHKHITYLTNPSNRGGSYSRNQGLFKANGQFITFLDDDDEIDPKKIERQLSCLLAKDDSYVACHCCYHKIHPNGHIYTSKEHIQGDVYYYALTKAIDLGSGSNLLLNTAHAKKIGGYDISFKRNQDLEFTTRLLKGKKLAYLDEDLLTVHHEVRDFKLTYAMVKTIDQHYTNAFINEIDALPTRARKNYFKRIALEEFRAAVFFHQPFDGLINLWHNHVSPWLFLRYCCYVLDNMITKRPYAFKIKP